jgi:hypothetical protein
VNQGIDNVIRVGGQSKSTILANKNLRIRSQSETKTMTERSILRETISRLEEYEEMIAYKVRTARCWKSRIACYWDIFAKHLSTGIQPICDGQ